MHTNNDTYVPDDLPATGCGSGVPWKPMPRFTPPEMRKPRASLGFALPVLIVCGALWFLLGGSRLF